MNIAALTLLCLPTLAWASSTCGAKLGGNDFRGHPVKSFAAAEESEQLGERYLRYEEGLLERGPDASLNALIAFMEAMGGSVHALRVVDISKNNCVVEEIPGIYFRVSGDGSPVFAITRNAEPAQIHHEKIHGLDWWKEVLAGLGKGLTPRQARVNAAEKLKEHRFIYDTERRAFLGEVQYLREAALPAGKRLGLSFRHPLFNQWVSQFDRAALRTYVEHGGSLPSHDASRYMDALLWKELTVRRARSHEALQRNNAAMFFVIQESMKSLTDLLNSSYPPLEIEELKKKGYWEKLQHAYAQRFSELQSRFRRELAP